MKKIVISLLLFSILIIAGCERYVESENPVRSLPEALAAPVNVTVALGNQSVTLSWEMSDSSGVQRFRVYSAEAEEGPYTLRDSTDQFSREVQGLQVNQAYYLSVAAVSSGGVEGERSEPVYAPVDLLQITIDGNNKYTNSRFVSVGILAGSSVTHVRLSEDSLFADAVYETFTPTKGFQLSSGDGEKTVFADFLFVAGADLGVLLWDNIILDTRANVSSVSFSPAGPFVTGNVITFFVDGGEVGGSASISFDGSGNIALNDDGLDGDATAGDGLYSADYTVPNDLVVTEGQVTGSFTDAAGNTADAVSSQTISIESAPLPVQIMSIEAPSSYQLSLTWTEAASTDFESYRVCRGLTNNPSVFDQIQTISSKSTTAFVDTTVAENTTYYYDVRVFNHFGLYAGSDVRSVTTPSNEAPAPVVLAGTIDAESVVSLSWSQNADEDFASYRVYRSTSAISDTPSASLLTRVINSRTTVTDEDYAPFGATYHYRVFVFDRQGESAGSNEYIVTPVAP